MSDLNWNERLQVLSIQFVPFIMAVVFHEVAHGWAARKFGDKTAESEGRLTLNPLPHIDPIGTILFPVINMVSGIPILFGWAKPVPIDARNFTKLRPGLFWVSFAGPGMNFILATLSGAVFAAIKKWVPEDFFLFEPLIAMTYVSVSLNFALGLFNLVPIPPLDGSKMIESFLPKKWIYQYEKIAPYSFFILMGLLMIGAFKVLEFPIRLLSNLVLLGMTTLFGAT
ncbi:MAG: site-2 protease family protein [Bdellovibrionales bacterium]|nr:site-2 protease family protein [Bdellovibrionales bacterium]